MLGESATSNIPRCATYLVKPNEQSWKESREFLSIANSRETPELHSLGFVPLIQPGRIALASCGQQYLPAIPPTATGKVVLP